MRIGVTPNVVNMTANKTRTSAQGASSTANINPAPEAKGYEFINKFKDKFNIKEKIENVKKFFADIKNSSFVKKAGEFFKNIKETISKNNPFKNCAEKAADLFKKAKESPIVQKVVKFAQDCIKKVKP